VLTIPRTHRLPQNVNRARIHVIGKPTTNVVTTLTPACQLVNHSTFHVACDDIVSTTADHDMRVVKAWVVGHRKNTANHVSGMAASHRKTRRNTPVMSCSDDDEL